MIRSITMMIVNMIQNSESPFGDQSLRAGGTALLAATARGKERSTGGKGCGGSTLR